MVFSAASFLFVFLPLTILLYFASPRFAKNGVLLITSLIFYLWGGGEFTILLLVSITVNWLLGRWISRYSHTSERQLRPRDVNTKRLILWVTWIFNLGLLGYWKYANFIVSQINGIIPQTIGDWHQVILPIGISFFTFQALSYVLDVGAGQTPVQKNWTEFALYVAFFPQLIAGPIVRYRDIAQQIEQRDYSWNPVPQGMIRFAYGLSKKVLIADSVAKIADATFEPGITLSFSAAWLGLLAYTIQLYFDFSGYSDMAIGLGKIFGFTFPENFCRPYSAISISDFWRRWHLTLSQWIRDYIYIPLGGSRRRAIVTYRNLAIAFLFTGIWHGAAWTFIIWGMYHGFWVMVERWQGWSSISAKSPSKLVLRRILTIAIVMGGWVIFRSAKLPNAIDYYQALIQFNTDIDWSLSLREAFNNQAQAALLIGSLIFVLPGNLSFGKCLDISRTVPTMTLKYSTALLFFPVSLILTIANQFSAFLYFQF